MAINFSGSFQYASFLNATLLNTITTAITLSAWINPASLALTAAGVLSRLSPTNKVYLWNLGLAVGAPRFQIQAGGNSVVVQSATAVPLNKWSHLASTWNGSAVALYLNGSLIGSGSVGGTMATSTEDIGIGCTFTKVNGNNKPQDFFMGSIDDARVYNRALSANEVQTIAAIKGRDMICHGLLCRYEMNELAPAGVPTSLMDSGPNGQNATVSGTPAYIFGIG